VAQPFLAVRLIPRRGRGLFTLSLEGPRPASTRRTVCRGARTCGTAISVYPEPRRGCVPGYVAAGLQPGVPRLWHSHSCLSWTSKGPCASAKRN